MLIAPHAAAGAAIAVLVPHPAAAIPLALASHYALDTVPHWQESLPPYRAGAASLVRIPIDIALSAGLVWLIASFHPDHSALVWSAAFAANAPDVDSAVVVFPRLLRWRPLRVHWDWHSRIQRETASYWGLLPQLVVCALSLLAIAA